MTAPLPRGYVRLTIGGQGPLSPTQHILIPARNIVVRQEEYEFEGRRTAWIEHVDSGLGQTWRVRETVAEVQAALVAALGAQDGDDDLTVAYMAGSASNVDEIASLKLQLANVTAAAEVAARAHGALKTKLDAERQECDELADRMFAPEWLRRSSVTAHKTRRAAEALMPEGGA